MGREAGTRTIAWWAGRVGCGQQRWAARLTPKLLILRLTTRGLARSRRLGTRCRNSSVVVAVMARASRRGGKARLAHDLAADHAKGADERDPVGVDLAVQGGLVHELPDGVVDQEHAPHLLLHSFGGLGAQHQTGAALVGLQLIQGALQLPPLGVQRGQLDRGAASGSRIVVTSR
jgi:hypothetical protein